MNRRSITIHTENPKKSLWFELSFFESDGNVRKFLKERFPKKYRKDPTLTNAVQQLSYAVKQAREFYNAASYMSLITSPLMYFYGMSNLAKALMVACSGQVVMSSGHGLKDVSNNITSSDIDKFTIEVQGKGTFHNFYKCYSKPNQLKNTCWRLKELLSVIPELKYSFEEIYSEKSNIVDVIRKVHRDRSLAYISDSRFSDNPTNIAIMIPKLHEQYLLPPQVISDGGLILYEKMGASEDITIRSVLGERYFILSVNKGADYFWLPELSTHYMLMFILSMLVRYEPRVWGECLTNRLSGIPHIIERFLEVSARKFPNIILNEMKNCDYWFTQETQKDIVERVVTDEKELYEIVKAQEHKKALEMQASKFMLDLME